MLAEIDELLSQRSPLFQRSTNQPVADGRGDLLWSTPTADVNPFARPESVIGGGSYQNWRGNTVENVVSWGSVELVGVARLEPISAREARVTITDVYLDGLPVVGKLRCAR